MVFLPPKISQTFELRILLSLFLNGAGLSYLETVIRSCVGMCYNLTNEPCKE